MCWCVCVHLIVLYSVFKWSLKTFLAKAEMTSNKSMKNTGLTSTVYMKADKSHFIENNLA